MADSTTLEIILEAVDNFTDTLDSALENTEKKTKSLGDKAKGIGSGISKALGGTAVAGLTAFGGAALGGVTALGALGLAFGKMAKDAAPIEGIQNSFNGLTEDMEGGSRAMLQALEDSSNGMVSQIDLMTSFNKASQLVSTDFAQKMPDAMQYLSKVSASTGQDMSYLTDSLVTGVGRLSPMILDNLGITMDATLAYETYAESIGKSASELSKGEQQTALMNQVVEKLAENTADMPDVATNASTAFAQMGATLTNLKNEVGMAFIPVLTELVGVLTPLISDLLYPLAGIAKALVPVFSALISAISPLLNLFGEFAQGLGEIMDAFFNEDAGRAIGALVDNFEFLSEGLEEIIPTLVTQGGEFLLKIVEGMIGALPAIVGVVSTVIESFITAMIPLLPRMMVMGLELILTLATAILEAIPELMPLGLEIILGLVDGLMASLPSLISTGLEVIGQFALGIIQQIPLMLGLATDIINSLVDGIATGLPIIIETGIEVLVKLIEGIVEALPQILEAGIEALLSLIDGIVSALPKLIPVALDAVLTLSEALLENLPLIIQAGIDALLAFIEGILDMLPELIPLALDIVLQLVEAILNNLPLVIEAGVEILLAIVSGIIDSIDLLIQALPAIWYAITDWFKNKDWLQIGKDIVGGIGEGITGAWTAIKKAFGNLLDGLPEWAKKLLGIASPSKVFMDIGENITKGLGIGMEDGMSLPRSVIANLPDLRALAPSSNSNTYNRSNQFTINLSGSGEPSEDIMRTVRLAEAVYG